MFNHHKGKRRKFRSNNKPFRRRHNGEGHRGKSLNSILNGHVRSGPIKGPHHVQKLIEKYTNLAKEALSTGDKILSENYLQHADHFSRMNLANNVANNENKSFNVDNSSSTKKEEISNENNNFKSDNIVKDKLEKE